MPVVQDELMGGFTQILQLAALWEKSEVTCSLSQEKAKQKEQRGHCPGVTPPPLTTADHGPCLH